jgi:CPA2 family monovalent cation:H+ antiporter-2
VSPAHQDLLTTLAVTLGVAAVTTVICQRLRQPTVLGYLLAGLLVGPHVPVPLVADQHNVHIASELGVILVMFSIGLEFSLRRLLSVGATAGVAALIEIGIMLSLGYLGGVLFGWSRTECLFAGALVAISSTTIIARTFADLKISGPLADRVFGVLIVEDLVAILLLATLPALASGENVALSSLGLTTGRLFAFVLGALAIGLFLVPRAVRAVVKLGRPETTVVAAIGLCFALALIARAIGYSVALGAFLAGSLVAESGETKQIEKLVEPVRDIFAAIFFVAVGMMIDPGLMVKNWGPILVLVALVVVGKVAGVTVGVFLTGGGVRGSVRAGMSMAQIGEFSFIIAGLGQTLGATSDALYPIAVAVSVVTTLLTPWLVRASDPVANWVDRKLPHQIQTFASLYGSWLAQLGSGPSIVSSRSRRYRILAWLLIDAAAAAGIAIGAAMATGHVAAWLGTHVPAIEKVARPIVLASAGLLAIPFGAGIWRAARSLGAALAADALPSPTAGKVDLAEAPRRVFTVTVQIGVLITVGAPLVAITQPFLPPFGGAAVLFAMLAAAGIGFWRSTHNLQGHVTAGAQVVLEALASQTAPLAGAHGGGGNVGKNTLAGVHRMLPGLGEPMAVRLEAESPAIGRTLAELDLRGRTGATVLALHRGASDVLVPTGREVLQPGDVLAIAGTPASVAQARDALLGEGG